MSKAIIRFCNEYSTEKAYALLKCRNSAVSIAAKHSDATGTSHELAKRFRMRRWPSFRNTNASKAPTINESPRVCSIIAIRDRVEGRRKYEATRINGAIITTASAVHFPRFGPENFRIKGQSK